MQPPAKTIVRPWSEFVPPLSLVIRHGVWLTDAKLNEHMTVAPNSAWQWRHWVEGLPVAETRVDSDGRLIVKDQRSQGRYRPSEHTITWYQRNVALATGARSVEHEYSLLGTPGSGETITETDQDFDASKFVFTSPSNEPNSADWPNGTYRVQYDITAASSALTYSPSFGRVDSALTALLESSTSAPAQNGTGLKLFSVSWDPSAGGATDRFDVNLFFDVSNMNQSLTLRCSSDAWADGPWPDISQWFQNQVFGRRQLLISGRLPTRADAPSAASLVAETITVDKWFQPEIIAKLQRYLPPHQQHQADPVLTDAMRPETVFTDKWFQGEIIGRKYPEHYIRSHINDSALIIFEDLFGGVNIDSWFQLPIIGKRYPEFYIRSPNNDHAFVPLGVPGIDGWYQPEVISKRLSLLTSLRHLQAEPVLTEDLRSQAFLIDRWFQPEVIAKLQRYLPPHQQIQADPVLTEELRNQAFLVDRWFQPEVIAKRLTLLGPVKHLQAEPVLTEELRGQAFLIDRWFQPQVIARRYPEHYIRAILNDTALTPLGVPNIEGWYQPQIIGKLQVYPLPHQHFQADIVSGNDIREGIFIDKWYHPQTIAKRPIEFYRPVYNNDSSLAFFEDLFVIPSISGWYQPEIRGKRYPEHYIRAPLNDSALLILETLFEAVSVAGWYQPQIRRVLGPEFYIRAPLNDSALVYFEEITSPGLAAWLSQTILPPGYRVVGVFRNRSFIITAVVFQEVQTGVRLLLVI